MRRAKTTPQTTNPWGLTPAQVQAMDALVKLGCDKLVARELGVSTRTVQEHIQGARRHMHAPTRLHCALAFDRWRTPDVHTTAPPQPQPQKATP